MMGPPSWESRYINQTPSGYEPLGFHKFVIQHDHLRLSVLASGFLRSIVHIPYTRYSKNSQINTTFANTHLFSLLLVSLLCSADCITAGAAARWWCPPLAYTLQSVGRGDVS